MESAHRSRPSACSQAIRSTERRLMRISRRSLMATAMLGLAGVAAARSRPLRILIMGGTGFTGPHQVRYALSRGHQVTLFNRGRQRLHTPQPVEQLVGDRETGDLRA